MEPSTPGWTLNTLTDTLLKKEFDQCRSKKQPHRILIKNGLDHIIPFQLEFDTEDQEERFIDKDWEYESFTFTLDLKGPNSNDFINYTDSELFSLEII